MSEVQTVIGRIAPEALGFTLPHEHTGIALWQIEGRWDYWQLTVDDATVLPELAAYRAAGGASLVDLTLPGVGRDPERLRRYAEATGLNIVMGAGWYRSAYYPAEAQNRSADRRRPGRRARPRVRRGRGRDRHPARDRRRDRHRQAVADRPGGARPPGRRPAARRTGMAITTHAVLSPVGLAQLAVFEEEGVDPARVVIGHADSYPVLDHYLEIVRRGANLEFDFLGMSFTPVERHGEGRIVELLGELVGRGHADRILLSQDVCHDSQLKAYGGNGYVYLFETFLPRLREAGLPESAIRTMTVDNRRPTLTLANSSGVPIARGWPRYAPDSATFSFNATETGQPSRVASAAARKPAASRPGHPSDDGQRAGHDPPAGLELVERDGRTDGQVLGGRAAAGQRPGQGHLEARRVGRGDELLGARPAVGRLGPGRPGHGQVAERPARDA